MKRLLAVIVSIALIGGAIAVRSRTGGGAVDRPVRLTVGCASVVIAPCRAWAQASGFTVVELGDPPPLTGYPVPADTDAAQIDVVVAPEPFAGFALGPTDPPQAVASSPVVLVVRAADSTTVRSPATAWSDAIDAGVRVWSETPGSWFAPVVVAGLIVSEVTRDAAQAGTAVPEPSKLARNDLDSDAALDALADLTTARGRASSSIATTSDAIGAMLGLEIDVVATLRARAGTRARQRVITPEPKVTAVVSVAVRRDLPGDDRARIDTAALTRRLRTAGFDPPAAPGPSEVSQELLIGLAEELRS